MLYNVIVKDFVAVKNSPHQNTVLVLVEYWFVQSQYYLQFAPYVEGPQFTMEAILVLHDSEYSIDQRECIECTV